VPFVRSTRTLKEEACLLILQKGTISDVIFLEKSFCFSRVFSLKKRDVIQSPSTVLQHFHNFKQEQVKKTGVRRSKLSSNIHIINRLKHGASTPPISRSLSTFRRGASVFSISRSPSKCIRQCDQKGQQGSYRLHRCRIGNCCRNRVFNPF